MKRLVSFLVTLLFFCAAASTATAQPVPQRVYTEYSLSTQLGTDGDLGPASSPLELRLNYRAKNRTAWGESRWRRAAVNYDVWRYIAAFKAQSSNAGLPITDALIFQRLALGTDNAIMTDGALEEITMPNGQTFLSVSAGHGQSFYRRLHYNPRNPSLVMRAGAFHCWIMIGSPQQGYLKFDVFFPKGCGNLCIDRIELIPPARRIPPPREIPPPEIPSEHRHVTVIVWQTEGRAANWGYSASSHMLPVVPGTNYVPKTQVTFAPVMNNSSSAVGGSGYGYGGAGGTASANSEAMHGSFTVSTGVSNSTSTATGSAGGTSAAGGNASGGAGATGTFNF